MSNFWTRTITGLSMVFILLLALFFSGWVFAAIFLVITVLGLWEFYGLIAAGDCQPQKYYGTVAGALLFAGTTIFCLVPMGGNFFSGIWYSLMPFVLPIPLFFISFIIEIYRKKPRPLVNIGVTNLGIIYIALPLSLLVFFNMPGVLHFLGLPVVLVAYFGCTWLSDTTAYLYGKQFGKHKFFERISPKKTWEGTIAGCVITLAAAAAMSFWVTELPLADWLAIAAIVLFFGTHGDLAESLIKRSLNIKDSGNILPGHGGILDRFDTMLISAPFVFLYFFLRQTF